MNNNSSAALYVVETRNASQTTRSAGASSAGASMKPRTGPVLVSSTEPTYVNRRLVSRKEALRQAILRTG